MVKRLFVLLMICLSVLYLNAQVKVKGVVLEANTNPASGVVKKTLAGVQIKAMGAVAPEVTDNGGNFSLSFNGKKPGDIIRGISLIKTGYEVFNREMLENWKIAGDPNWIDKIKMCPAGTIDRLREYNYKNLYNTLLAQYNRQKAEMNKLKVSDAEISKKLQKLDDDFKTQQNQLEEYADRFSRLDFDDVSDLYRKAYILFSAGKLDSVAKVLEEADVFTRTNKRLEERKRIGRAKAEIIRQETGNEAGIKEDMEVLKMLAQTYTLKFEYEKATPLYEQLILLDSTNVDNLLTSAIYFSERKNYDRGIDLFSKIIESTDSLDWHKGSASLRLGELQQELGLFDMALSNYQKSYWIYNSLAIQDASNELYSAGLGRVLYTLGGIHQTMGNLEQALKEFQESNRLEKELCQTNPKSKHLKAGLAISYQYLGAIHLAKKNEEQALKYFKESYRVEKELFDTNPKNETLKFNLASSLSWIGYTYRIMNQMDEALKYTIEYANFLKELYDANPNAEDLKNGLAVSYRSLGIIEQSLEKKEEAMKNFKEYNRLEKELFYVNPKKEDWKNQLAISYFHLGDIHKAMGHTEDVLQNFLEYNYLEKSLFDANPKNEDIKNELACSCLNVSDICQYLNYLEDALKYCAEYNRLVKELYQIHPQSEKLHDEFVNSVLYLGIIHQKKGNMEQALKEFEECNRLLKELYQTSPKREGLKDGLAISYQYLGNIHQLKGNIKQALKEFEESNKLKQELYNANSKTFSIQDSYLSSLGNLSWFYLIDKQYQKSASSARAAIDIATKSNIEEAKYSWIYTNLAHALLLQGKYDEAKKIYMDWKDKPYPQDTTKTFKEMFLKDFDELEKAGIICSDVAKIRELLNSNK